MIVTLFEERPEAKTYEGYMSQEGIASVIVRVDHDSRRVHQYPLVMSKLGKQKSSSFSWGYSGSGPTALAHSILLDLLGPDVANAFHVEFREIFIATLPEWFHSVAHPGRVWILQGNTMRRWFLHLVADHPGTLERLKIASCQDWPDNPRPKKEQDSLHQASWSEEERHLLEEPTRLGEGQGRGQSRGIF